MRKVLAILFALVPISAHAVSVGEAAGIIFDPTNSANSSSTDVQAALEDALSLDMDQLGAGSCAAGQLVAANGLGGVDCVAASGTASLSDIPDVTAATGAGQILEWDGDSWEPIATPGGGGGSIVLDETDNGATETATEVATSSASSNFEFPGGGKMLIRPDLPWTTAPSTLASIGDVPTPSGSSLVLEYNGSSFAWIATPSGGGGGHTIANEGVSLPARGTLNFTGNGIDCSDDAGSDETDCVVILPGLQTSSNATAFDLDGNGYPDSIEVGDYDDDGTLETVDDLNAALRAARISTGHISGIDATDASGCAGANDCFIRDDGGDFGADGFVVGMEVVATAFAAAILDESDNLQADNIAGCGGSDPCFKVPAPLDLTTFVALGQKVRPRNWSGTGISIHECTVTAVVALQVDVDCGGHDFLPGLEDVGPKGFVQFDGNNGLFTVVALPTATEMAVERIGADGSPVPDGSELIAEAGGPSLEKISHTEPLHVRILPGDYAGANRPASQQIALLELDSFMTLDGGSPDMVMIRGRSSTTSDAESGVTIGTGENDAIIAYEVWLKNFTVTGEWSEGLGTPTQVGGRQVVGMWGVTGGGIENVHAMDGGHTCFYTANARDFVHRDTVARDCGNKSGLYGISSSSNQPCYYTFANSEGASEGNRFSNVLGEQCGSAAFITRKDAIGDFVGNMTVADAVFRDTTGPCWTGRSADGIFASNILCDNTGGFTTPFDADSYSHIAVQRDLIVDGLTLLRTHTNPALFIDDHIINASFTDIYIDGSESPDACIRIDAPARSTSIVGGVVKNCAGQFLSTADDNLAFGGGDEGVTIGNVRFENSGVGDLTTGTELGFQFNDHLWNWNLYGLVVSGVKGAAMRFVDGLSNSTVEMSIDGRWPYYMGVVTEAEAAGITLDASLKNRWYVFENASSFSDCNPASGTGSSKNSCAIIETSPGVFAWQDATTVWPTMVTDSACVTITGASDSNVFDLDLKNCADAAGVTHSGGVTNTEYRLRMRVDPEFRSIGGLTSEDGILLGSGDSNLTIDATCDGIDEDCIDLNGQAWSVINPQSKLLGNVTSAQLTGACSTGTLATASDGGAGTTLCVCEASAWACK